MMSRCGVKYFSMTSSAVVSLAPEHEDVFRVDLSTGIGAGVDAGAAASAGAAGAVLPPDPTPESRAFRTCADHLSSANIRTKTPTPTDRALRVLIVSPSLLLLQRQRRFPHRGQVRHLFHRRGNRSSGCCAPFHLGSKSGSKVVTQGALFSSFVIQQSARGASLRRHSSRLRVASRRGSLINKPVLLLCC